ncbi:MAG: cytochrome c oxidase subunit II [Scytonematopsis contorta HA4267-MV1]|nr:cytochrome c oxidase subunit II [Scytonematopsis contorta HA4267-MV1]
MKIPSSIWTLLIGILMTLASLWYGQNHGLLPTAASDEAGLVDGLFNAMMTVSTGIFILVQGILIYSAFRYRKRKDDDSDGPPVHGNIPLEILWTAIPAVIVLGISVYSFDVYNEMGGFEAHGGHGAPMNQEAMSTSAHMSHNMPGSAMAATLSDTAINSEANVAEVAQMDMDMETSPSVDTNSENKDKSSALQVNVTAMQYAFIFTYPETGITSGELHAPIGRTVELKMTGSDVIHAFWVPEFRLKQDVIPGRETEYRFTPKKAGDYAVVCAELCGPYHGAMRTTVVVEPEQDFDKWMQEQLVASKEELNKAVALNPEQSFADEFLAPYTKDMGIKPEILNQIHH